MHTFLYVAIVKLLFLFLFHVKFIKSCAVLTTLRTKYIFTQNRFEALLQISMYLYLIVHCIARFLLVHLRQKSVSNCLFLYKPLAYTISIHNLLAETGQSEGEFVQGVKVSDKR